MSMAIRFKRIPRIYFILGIAVVIIVYLILANGRINPEDKYNFKQRIMDNLIRSAENQVGCQIPVNLPVNSPEMMSFIHDEPAVDCGPTEDWVSCSMSTCSVKKSIIDDRGSITCEYSEILRQDNDLSIEYKSKVQTSRAYELTSSDFAVVKCWDKHWNTWSGFVYGLRERTTDIPARSSSNDERPKINVLMYGFDSMSRNSFMRTLPVSYKYITETLKGDVLQGYNIVGDGTPQALIPILSGFTELELPETRRRMDNSKYVDEVYPFIWKAYENEGYVTAFNEDLPNVGTFTYRLNGFKKQPTTHFMRTYYLGIEPEMKGFERLCVGQQPRHQVMMNYTTQFMQAYSHRPHFVFSFHGELSHDSINLVGVADQDLTSWMKNLRDSGALDNTILIMMSDHGNRFADVRNTLQGKLEERLPFFSFVFPEWFKQKYSKEYSNFVTNTKRLTTPFDVHATLAHILDIQQPDRHEFEHTTNPNAAKRAISLFREIDSSRSCADAYIEPHWCVCMNWRPITNTQDETVLKVARSLVAAINKVTAPTEHLCERLYLHEVQWAAKLAPHDNLLRFKNTNDRDGFLTQLGDKMKVQSEMYQIKIVVKPGNSIFEASVQHHLDGDVFDVPSTAISRVNKYGDQARCIMDLNPELRKYCYCKSTPA